MTAIDCITAILTAAGAKEKSEIADFFARTIHSNIARLLSQTQKAIADTSKPTHEKDIQMIEDCQALMTLLTRFYDLKQQKIQQEEK